MNERILELAEQAWDATAVSPDFGHPVSFAEKFAELLIKECGEIAVLGDPRYSAQHNIHKHFGVE